jgi:hypothetical protein
VEYIISSTISIAPAWSPVVLIVPPGVLIRDITRGGKGEGLGKRWQHPGPLFALWVAELPKSPNAGSPVSENSSSRQFVNSRKRSPRTPNSAKGAFSPCLTTFNEGYVGHNPRLECYADGSVQAMRETA